MFIEVYIVVIICIDRIVVYKLMYFWKFDLYLICKNENIWIINIEEINSIGNRICVCFYIRKKMF